MPVDKKPEFKKIFGAECTTYAYVQYKRVFINHFNKGMSFCVENKQTKSYISYTFLHRQTISETEHLHDAFTSSSQKKTNPVVMSFLLFFSFTF